MSARRLVAGVVALALWPAVAAQPASAQSGPEVLERTAELAVDGQLTLEFRGADGARCPGTAACGLSGIASWTPPGDAVLYYGDRGPRVSAAVAFGGPDPGVVTRARVTRVLADGTARVCSDAQSWFSVSERVTRGTGEVEIGLGGGREWFSSSELFSTRCAGPRPEDLAAALPSARVPLAEMRPGATFDLRGERAFTAGGLTGTVRSSLVLRVRSDRAQRGDERPVEAPERRLLVADYAIERVTGTVRTDLRASEDPAVCGPLDACGLTGSLTRRLNGRPAGPGATITLSAERPRDNAGLRAALGRLPAGAPRPRRTPRASGYGRAGSVGTLSADLVQAGGPPACRDRVPAPGGLLSLGVHGGRLEADYVEETSLRTRCPGPIAGGLDSEATGSLPLRVLRRRRVVLRLRSEDRSGAGPFATATFADVTIVLRRRSVRMERTAGWTSIR